MSRPAAKRRVFFTPSAKIPAPNSPANKKGGESPAAQNSSLSQHSRRKTPPTPILRFRVPRIPPPNSSSTFSPLRRRFSNSSPDFRRRSHHFTADFANSSSFFFDVPIARRHRRLSTTADSLLLSVFPAPPPTPTASPLPATTLKEGSERYKSQPQLLLESFLLSKAPIDADALHLHLQLSSCPFLIPLYKPSYMPK